MKYHILDADTALARVLASLGKSERLVLCGSPDEREYLDEQLELTEQTEETILKAAQSIDVQQWFNARKAQYTEDFGEDFADIEGEWPGKAPGQPLTLHTDISSGKPLKSVLVAQMTVDKAWEIPAKFKYGDWNECPAPEAHCAIWQYWHQQYGAEIVGVSHDVIEAKLSKPPKTQEAAMALAWEQYLYCNDIVDQGVDSVSNLAATLIEHDTWYFWWD